MIIKATLVTAGGRRGQTLRRPLGDEYLSGERGAEEDVNVCSLQSKKLYSLMCP